MLPNFLITGAQKAATTWLARALEQHPDVFVAPEKEVGYFDLHYDRGIAWYESRFAERRQESAVGEATPMYLHVPEVDKRIEDSLGKDVKFIVSLRHPVDRAHSAFWHFLARGKYASDADFRTAFESDEPFHLRTNGLYGAQLRRFFERFPREHVLVLLFEELKEDNQAALRRCMDFLGVDGSFEPNLVGERRNQGIGVKPLGGTVQFMDRNARQRVRVLPPLLRKPAMRVGKACRAAIQRVLPTRRDYEKLDPEIRADLLQYYLQDIRQLEDLLDRDLSVWLHGSDRALAPAAEK